VSSTKPQQPNLSPAPRAVPLTLSIRVVMGGVMSQFGWGIMAFGMIFVWAFDAGGALRSSIRFAGELATAEGVSTGWRQTSLTINDVRVYETSYSFRSGDGYDLTGASYQTGGYVEGGQPVTVEYVPSNPSLSRILGMRASSAGLAVSLVYIFPIIGLALVMAGLRKGLRARRLLSTGQLAFGTLKSKEPTSTQINNQTVFRYTFEFEVPGGGRHEVVAKTHRPTVLEDEELERIVFDPRYPGEATLLDELPCRPSIDSRGDFSTESQLEFVRAGLNLVLPATAVAVYVASALMRN
jgi:hypothetical protein